jgi:hypothetical protein
MPLIQPLQVPEELLQRYLTSTKTRELYELVYISSIRPDPRDLDQIVLVSVTVRTWAQDARGAIERLITHPQLARTGRYATDAQELTVLSLVSCGPVSGNSGGGIDEGSMLDTDGEITDEQITDIRKLNSPN